MSYLEIEAWCRLYGEPLGPWEIGLLDRMEASRMAALNTAASEPEAPPLTPSLFKEMFAKG